ncbi:hypothetical protein PT974_06971 [Cladobotryum mycophilum]|uniref:AB hydrolase-1 domain-containing protein n=1 Tax=Cladobotryum mycophilum TaxID=491253 RepID=A0ABR0SN15_9HYPO
MRASSVITLASTVAVSVAHGPSIQKRGPQCTEVRIPVSVLADNIALPPIDATNLFSILNNIGDAAFGVLTVNGNYTLAGRYCEPEVHIPQRQNTIQLLVHGATYNKNYWSGLDFPQGYHGNDYSWIAYASQQGYPTLSIDRLGSGDSDKPDPIKVVQIPVQAEAMYQTTLSLRAGTIEGIGRSFNKIVYIGHSLGSMIGNAMSARHGEAVDALVLTGYTKRYKPDLPGIFAKGVPIPAAVFDSARFSGLPAGYVVFGSKAGRGDLFYSIPGVEYDPAIYELDWSRQDALALGDGVSAFFSVDVAAGFKGPVLVVVGRQDNCVCSLALPIISHGDCGQGPTSLPAQVGELYPSASSFSYSILPNTGHDLNAHYSINQTLSDVHSFLGNKGF